MTFGLIMRSQLLKNCAYPLSTALLAACGESGTTAGEAEVLGENQSSTVVGQPIADSQVQNDRFTGNDTNGSVSTTDSETQSTDKVANANDSVSLIAATHTRIASALNQAEPRSVSKLMKLSVASVS